MIYKALTIAGSDPAGCAGIQADLKTFSALKVFGMSVITALTSQNTVEVSHIMPVTAKSLETQIDAIYSDMGADAVKTGMLFSKELIDIVADRLKHWQAPNLVVDPVIVSSSGAQLLKDDAVNAIMEKLFPLAKVITPNIPEAEWLTGIKINTLDDAHNACRKLLSTGTRSVLLKGGHAYGKSMGEAKDLWYDGHTFYEFSYGWVDTKNLHGTGCTFSAAITAYLAMHNTMEESIRKAKIYISKAIESAVTMEIGKGSGPVDHFWQDK